MSPLLLYGGTFDPVHLGHLQVARAVAERMAAPVSLLPAADPPHRALPGASAAQRARMIALAIEGDARLRLDERELRRNGPSYTVDTLRELRAELGAGAPIIWILGVDSLLQLDGWHDWTELLQLAHLLGVQRPGTQVGRDWLRDHAPRVHEELAPRWTRPDDLAGRAAGGYAALAIRPLRRESATDVRARIAAGAAWKHLVAPPVAAFIESAGLYRPGPGARV